MPTSVATSISISFYTKLSRIEPQNLAITICTTLLNEIENDCQTVASNKLKYINMLTEVLGQAASIPLHEGFHASRHFK